MPNGIDWKKITGEDIHPLEKLRTFLERFAQQEKFRLYVNSYHDAVHVEFSKKAKGSHGEWTTKIIRMGLLEVGDELLCSINISAKVSPKFSQSLKRLVSFGGKSRKQRSQESSRMEREVGRLSFPIDQNRLSLLLTTAKTLLDDL